MSDEIIPLSRWRAALARARRGRKADAIISEPDAEQLVPTLPVQELYYAIKEVGLADAAELVALATPAQVQGFVDLDVWERDHLDERRVDAWIETLADAGYEKLGAGARRARPRGGRAVAAAAGGHLRSDHRDGARRARGALLPHPRSLLSDRHPRPAAKRARRSSARSTGSIATTSSSAAASSWPPSGSSPRDLEEHAWRWRQGRMADLGYVDFYEALSIYRYLDPASVKLDEGTFVGAAARDADRAAGGAGRLARRGRLLRQGARHAAVGRRRRAAARRRWCCSSTRRWPPISSTPATSSTARRRSRAPSPPSGSASSTWRAATSRAPAPRSTSVALERIFRVGFSLTLQLKTLADTLVKRGLDPVGLDEPWDDVMRALRARRPEYPRALDDAARRRHAPLRHARRRGPRRRGARDALRKTCTPPKRE